MFSSSTNKSDIRLSPSQLNKLIAQLATMTGLPLRVHAVQGLGLNHSSQQDCNLYIIETESKLFVISDVCKDAATKSNNSTIPYIGEVMHAALAKCKELGNPDKDVVLLFPVAQCRGYLKSPLQNMQKQHFVLLEVIATTKQLRIHDSQHRGRIIFYPDKFNTPEFRHEMGLNYAVDEDYKAYAVQGDDVVCGYFVHQFLLALLSGREMTNVDLSIDSSGQLVLTRLDEVPTTYASQADYLKQNGVDQLTSSVSYSLRDDGEDDFDV